MDATDAKLAAVPAIESKIVRPRLTGHIPALDGIRGLAILLVTVYRFNGEIDDGKLTGDLFFKAALFGYRGVDLFFVLSGFLITGILYDSKDASHYFRNFYARRALRIFPLYYGVLVVALVILPLLSHLIASVFAEARSHQTWLWFYGTNLFQARTGTWPFGCLNHFWSLAVEEHFYLVWPLVIYFASRRTAIAVCVGVTVLAPATRIGWLISGGNDVAPEVFTLFRADALAMGGLVALSARGNGGIHALLRFARQGLCLLGPLLLLLALDDRRFLTLPDSLFAAFFACLIVTAVTAPTGSLTGRFWNARWLRFFGKYSYGVYVFQYPLIPLLAPFLSVELLVARIGDPTGARLLYILLMTALSTLCAVASWHLFEKRFLALKRHFGGSAAIPVFRRIAHETVQYRS